MLENLLSRLSAPNVISDFILNAGANAIGTIVGGLFLTILYYLFGNRLFKVPDLNGLWAIGSTFNRTKYNPFRNMQVIYKIHLLQEGNRIYGSGEKVIERAAQTRTYVGAERQPMEIEGTIQKRYLARSQAKRGQARINCKLP